MHTLLFNWLDHVETIVVGAVLLVGFGVYAWVRGWPQRTIQSLNEVNEADEKALGRIKREKEALAAECEDIRLKGFSGLNLGELIREHDVNVPLAYLTGLDTEETRAEATSQRAFFW